MAETDDVQEIAGTVHTKPNQTAYAQLEILNLRVEVIQHSLHKLQAKIAFAVLWGMMMSWGVGVLLYLVIAIIAALAGELGL